VVVVVVVVVVVSVCFSMVFSVLLYRVVISTSEVLIEKRSQVFSFSSQHLNVTCDGHVVLTIEVHLTLVHTCIFCVYFFVLRNK